MENRNDIPQEWIKKYVESLLRVAQKFPEASSMRQASMLRADHAMDLVKAFRESQENT